MQRRLIGFRALGAAVATALLVPMLLISPAGAADPPVDCDPTLDSCDVSVGVPPGPGSPGGGDGGGSGSARAICLEGVTPVPCSSSSGTWSNRLQCYLQELTPQPPASDPVWQGRADGAVYMCTTALTPSTRLIWLPGPEPAGPTPEALARRALASLTLPSPVMRRSPTEANSDGGVPYTWVILWTWYWTEPASWKVLQARAQAGPVWAEVTVTPVRMVYTQ